MRLSAITALLLPLVAALPISTNIGHERVLALSKDASSVVAGNIVPATQHIAHTDPAFIHSAFQRKSALFDALVNSDDLGLSTDAGIVLVQRDSGIFNSIIVGSTESKLDVNLQISTLVNSNIDTDVVPLARDDDAAFEIKRDYEDESVKTGLTQVEIELAEDIQRLARIAAHAAAHKRHMMSQIRGTYGTPSQQPISTEQATEVILEKRFEHVFSNDNNKIATPNGFNSTPIANNTLSDSIDASEHSNDASSAIERRDLNESDNFPDDNQGDSDLDESDFPDCADLDDDSDIEYCYVYDERDDMDYEDLPDCNEEDLIHATTENDSCDVWEEWNGSDEDYDILPYCDDVQDLDAESTEGYCKERVIDDDMVNKVTDDEVSDETTDIEPSEEIINDNLSTVTTDESTSDEITEDHAFDGTDDYVSNELAHDNSSHETCDDDAASEINNDNSSPEIIEDNNLSETTDNDNASKQDISEDENACHIYVERDVEDSDDDDLPYCDEDEDLYENDGDSEDFDDDNLPFCDELEDEDYENEDWENLPWCDEIEGVDGIDDSWEIYQQDLAALEASNLSHNQTLNSSIAAINQTIDENDCDTSNNTLANFLAMVNATTNAIKNVTSAPSNETTTVNDSDTLNNTMNIADFIAIVNATADAITNISTSHKATTFKSINPTEDELHDCDDDDEESEPALGLETRSALVSRDELDNGSEDIPTYFPDTATGLKDYTTMLFNEITGQTMWSITEALPTLDTLVGIIKVRAYKRIAETLCVAQKIDREVCRVLSSYAVVFMHAEEKSYTFNTLAQVLNIERLDYLLDNIDEICLGKDAPGTTCDSLLGQIEVTTDAMEAVQKSGTEGSSNLADREVNDDFLDHLILTFL